MKPSDYKISLDILESQSQYSLPMKKGDTARVVYITLREGGVPYEIGRDCFAVLSGRKPDGTVLENNCVIKGNTIIYEITPQTTAVSGLVDCEIKLYGVDNGLICSPRFSIIVDERVVGDEEIESTPEFSALTKLYSNVVTSENARVDAEVKRVAAEGDRAKAEQEREANITQAIEDAEEATDKANDIADTLKTKLDNGEFNGEKGDKGDKGDTPAIDQKYNPTSENAQSGVAVAEALSDVANAVKVSASGNPIVIDDASPIKHTLDIKTTANETVYVRGKNLIPFDNKAYYGGRYVAGQTYEKNGVSFTVNKDGSVYAKGTATIGTGATFPLYLINSFKKGNDTVTLSGSPEGASATTYSLRLKNDTPATANYEDYGNGKTIENVNLLGSSITIVVIGGQAVDATFYPMLEFGDTVGEFVPPTDTQSVIADENGVVNGLTSVASEMCIFTETGVTIDCTYNKDTTKTVEEQINSVKDDIEKLGYRLLGTLTTEEDVQMISASQLEDGTTLKSLNIKKVFILFTGSFVNTTSSQPLCVLFNNGSVYQMYKSFNIIADRFYGLWFECEKIISLTDRTVYKSTYPSALLMNFKSDTGNAQGLSGNNVELCSDVAVYNMDTISSMKFGCFNSNNLIKAESTIYLFGV